MDKDMNKYVVWQAAADRIGPNTDVLEIYKGLDDRHMLPISWSPRSIKTVEIMSTDIVRGYIELIEEGQLPDVNELSLHAVTAHALLVGYSIALLGGRLDRASSQ